MLVTVFGIGIAIYMSATGESSNKINDENIDLAELAQTVSDNRENILLLGVDENVSSKEYNNVRTDTIMVFSVDPKSKTGFLLSVPRDTFTKVGKGNDKINHAHSKGGVPMTVESVTNLLSIPINHYIKADYKTVEQMVDTMGGVDINVPMDMHYEDPYADPPLVINLKKGFQTMDGQKAIQFLRFRKGYANQDLGRVNAQQEFIKACANKLLTPETIVKVPAYIKVLNENVETDMNFSDMIKIAAKTVGIKPFNIKKEMVPGQPGMKGGISYYFPDQKALKDMVDYLMSGAYYRGNQTASEDGQIKSEQDTFQTQKLGTDEKINQTAQKKLDIVVLNAGGISGRAKRASDLLKINNMEPIKIGNADKFGQEKTYIYTDDKNDGEIIADILETGELRAADPKYRSMGVEILIVLGKDFNK